MTADSTTVQVSEPEEHVAVVTLSRPDAMRAQRICSQTADHQEAVRAFSENREPEFEGN